MRLIHTCSGLLSIIGAAFLFATVHALITKPVSVDAPVLVTDAPISNPRPRGGSDTAEQPDPIDPVAQGETPPDTAPAGPGDELLDAPVPDGMLTLRQSYDLFEQGAYFVDARHEEEFNAGRIQYAAWLPATLFDTDSERAYAAVDSMPPDATVIIYCVGGECDASKNTAARLQALGFTDLRVMGVGYDQWVEAGFPIEEGQP